ncbi:ion channel [Anditalea andensis]|uniref:Potassium channel domain-containing protein n=1 Tax=Anditalea andensis TaxID=1048983 RepID=A0A074L2T9_9BACT|nr:ion channel [Anditalea andensis]KEO75504.1 hypothetical protein EL17_01255 [Anditalea andensis]
MEESIYLIIGVILLCIGFFDFFYTTLSASKSSFITFTVSKFVHISILSLERKFGRGIFALSGMILNLTIILVWILIIWAGLYFVFTYDADAILNNEGIRATDSERLYFTGYVLSTLGNGDFFPISTYTQMIASSFSFFGFIFFTTAMTYLISVYSAVINKRHLSLAILNLGNSPEEVIRTLHSAQPSFIYTQINSLQEKIDLVNEHYQAFPLIHYYHNVEINASFSLNVAKLDEALTIMLIKSTSPHHQELCFLKKSMDALLKRFDEFHDIPNFEDSSETLHWEYIGSTKELSIKELANNPRIAQRRKILTSLLLHEDLNWKHVYETQKLSSDD